MKWPWTADPMPEPEPVAVRELEGFVLGQIVQHKIDHQPAVIVEFYTERGLPFVVVAPNSKPGSDVTMSCYEIERLAETQEPGK